MEERKSSFNRLFVTKGPGTEIGVVITCYKEDTCPHSPERDGPCTEVGPTTLRIPVDASAIEVIGELNAQNFLRLCSLARVRRSYILKRPSFPPEREIV